MNKEKDTKENVCGWEKAEALYPPPYQAASDATLQERTNPAKNMQLATIVMDEIRRQLLS